MTTTAIDLDFTKPPALAMAEDTEATKQGEGVVEAGVSRSTLEEGKRTVVSEVEVRLLGSPVRGGDLGGSGEGEENLSARGIRDGLVWVVQTRGKRRSPILMLCRMLFLRVIVISQSLLSKMVLRMSRFQRS